MRSRYSARGATAEILDQAEHLRRALELLLAGHELQLRYAIFL